MAPKVSVVMATYNRANVLALALQTVRWQSCADWELIVVGDACTDHTAEVVERAHDPRIRFVNLAQNVGEQSGPNNHGCALARGDYVAFLNHDDFWLPDHLAGALAHLEKTGADLVFSLVDVMEPDGRRRLQGRAWRGTYDPSLEALASSWVFRRELLARVGPWRGYRQCYAVPSQDWLFRAWRMRARLIAWPVVSVLAIQSGSRKDSYRVPQEEEHRTCFERLAADPEAFRAQELDLLADELARAPAPPALWQRVAMKVGLYPAVVRQWLRLRLRRGTTIPRLRRIRGLPDLRP